MLKSKGSIYKLSTVTSSISNSQSFKILDKGYVESNLVKGSRLVRKINHLHPRGKAYKRVLELNKQG